MWDQPVFESGLERRRLKLLNGLAIGLAKAGATLSVRGDSARELSVVVGSTSVTLTLDHPKAKPDRNGQWKTREGPADVLELVIDPAEAGAEFQHHWADTAEAKLERKLTEIVVEIIVAGEAHYRAGRMRHHRWELEDRQRLRDTLERQRKDAERRANEQRLAEQQARREQLFAQAVAWRTARDIRGFVSDAMAKATDQNVRCWADWALAEADALDPALQGRLQPLG